MGIPPTSRSKSHLEFGTVLSAEPLAQNRFNLHHFGRRRAAMPLTGRFNFRRSLTGRVVLQVEEDKPLWWSRNGKTRRRFRDANVMDLANPGMRR